MFQCKYLTLITSLTTGTPKEQIPEGLDANSFHAGKIFTWHSCFQSPHIDKHVVDVDAVNHKHIDLNVGNKCREATMALLDNSSIRTAWLV